MILAIDIGNTRIKGAVFERNIVLGYFVFEREYLRRDIEEVLKRFENVTDLVVVSVRNIEMQSFLEFDNDVNVHFLSNEDLFPFKNNYATPKTLGIDRIVLASGAILQYSNQGRLIIDAGTCVTYDFVDEKDNYLGGAISPGLQLRYESLRNYTAKLPLLAPKEPESLIGSSTSEAMHSGVVNGLVYEIDGFIDQYKARYTNFITILTGGNALFLARQLKNTIFVDSNFLLKSLNQLFQYKIDND